jgi:APA family basic amino acid/polyamine antiporter
MNNNPLPLMILGGYAAVGAVIYLGYGFWNSKLAKGIDITEDADLESAVEALGRGVDDVKK